MYLLNYNEDKAEPKVLRLHQRTGKGYVPMLLITVLVLTWFFMPLLLRRIDPTTGSIDQSIWLLILLSVICFVLMTAISWWVLKQSWSLLGLPPFNKMVSQFNTLQVWQQLSFYWVSFFLLLLAALGCLSATYALLCYFSPLNFYLE